MCLNDLQSKIYKPKPMPSQKHKLGLGLSLKSQCFPFLILSMGMICLFMYGMAVVGMELFDQQICVEGDACPKAGAIVCNYNFLKTWGDAKLSSKTANPVTDPQIKRYLRLTGDISRELALGQSFRVNLACNTYVRT